MAAIRPLSPEDLPAVSRLLQDQMPLWEASPEFLLRSLIEDPWHEPEMGSLVAVDEGDVVGFIGGQVRRMRFGDRSLRGVCASHLVVSGDGRAGAAGALLLGRLIKGPQDLTWSDTATEVVARVWHAYGGHDDHARAADWRLVLRPARWLGERVTATIRGRLGREADSAGSDSEPAAPGSAGGGSRLAGSIQDISGAMGGGREPAGEAVEGRDARAAEIAECLPELSRGLDFHIDHDAAHLEHTMALIGENPNTTGQVVARIVRRRGRTIGWYLYLPASTGISRVLHLAASKPADVGAVFNELLNQAHAHGCVVLAGRLEPHLMDHLRGASALIGLARRPIFHAKDPALQAALGTRGALLSRLDGEWFAP